METALEESGAVSVTMTDAEDQPLYEPGPGETPLWNAVTVTGLYEGDSHPENIIMSLAGALLPDKLPEYKIQNLEDQDWERAWMQDFKPVKFGKNLWICPSWCEPTNSNAVNLLLDPGLAFGTGTHPTTALCLEWLDANPPVNQELIDYGCGSGILGIAALLLGAAEVIGVDNDPQALQATRDNCEKNNIALNRFPAYLPKDFSNQYTLMDNIEKTDGILANILAQPLLELAPLLAGLVKQDGWIVLSGILVEQAQMIIDTYCLWFELEEPVSQDGWIRISGIRNTHPVS